MTGGPITMVLSGDLYVQRPDPESIFEHTASYLREADLFFGNLEAAVTDVGKPSEAKGCGALFKSEERMLGAYLHAGLDAVGLANNHSMNYGMDGMQRTMDLLDWAGIAHTGAGADLDAAHRHATVERGGNRVAFLSYSSVFVPGFAATATRGGISTVRVSTAYEPQDRLVEVPGSPPIIRTNPDPAQTARMAEDIARAKRDADVVAVSWHWGLSPATGGDGRLVDYQQTLARAAVDAGADLVIGHHPHRLQAIEGYRGKVIFYSLGNFAFDLFRGQRQTTALARCRIEGGAIREVGFVPAVINEDAQPILAGAEAGAAIVEEVRALSTKFGTVFEPGPAAVVVRT